MSHPYLRRNAIFLGAGASAADGAPLQSTLFKDYFETLKVREEDNIPSYSKDIALFFNKMFDIDYKTADLEQVKLPTFEEALGILDLADSRNESFRDLPNINLDFDSGKIKFLRLYLVFLMAEIISEKLKSSNNLHRRLVQRLKRSELLANTFFITTNYDILCDNALLEVDDSVINYGFDFRNNWEGTLNYPDQRSSLLFKLHGSLNWLLCPTCNTVKQTPYVKSVYHLVSDPNQSYCNKCSSFYSPIIIPPTFYKDMSNVYLNMVWNKAELNLTYAAHLIFCGYSFPDADIHIKYLIKRIQKNRNKNNLKITVVNNHVGKSEEMKLEEKSRYTRFLGEQLNYTELSFEEFAANPGKILGEVKAKSSKSKKSIVY